MPINTYRGKDLKNQTFVMEECLFIDCVLTDCELFFSGGEAEIQNVTLNNCRWHWRGPAGKTLQLLHNLGMLKTEQIPPQQMVQSSGSIH